MFEIRKAFIFIDNKTRWKTRNILFLFPLKDKKNYISCVVYKGDCSCGSCYISETKRVAEVRWNEHNNPPKSSEPSKHLRNTLHGLSFQMLQRMVRPGRT